MDHATASSHTAQPEAAPERRTIGPREAVEIANDLQQHCDFANAEQMYLAVLSMAPEQPDALHFLGVMRHRQGRDREALDLMARAIQVDPSDPGRWLNFANVLLAAGEVDDAISALHNLLERAPEMVEAHNNLGVIFTRLGRWEEAERSLRRALEIDASRGFPHYNLARLYFRTGRAEESTQLLLQTLGLDVGNALARNLLSRAYFKLGNRDGAVQTLREWLAHDPDDPEAQHQLAAAGEAPAPPRASDAYVQQVFDSFSASFDAKLEMLGYRAPQVVADALEALGDACPSGAAVLDAGCGTGLCAPLLRPFAARLEGVDLSAGMLARARARGGYDALHHAELTAFLEAGPDRWDIIASADTLNYFGDLDPVFAAAGRALRPGGVLVATLEALSDGDDPVRLEVHGRYAHSRGYLEAALQRAGLRLVHIDQQVLRREFDEFVRGWVFGATRSEAGLPA